jgi:hypothetical protein
MRRRRVAAAIALMTILPVGADAECAWVLWRHTTGLGKGYSADEWEPAAGFAAHKACQDELGRRATWPATDTIQTDKGPVRFTSNYACLPDTFDPRARRP